MVQIVQVGVAPLDGCVGQSYKYTIKVHFDCSVCIGWIDVSVYYQGAVVYHWSDSYDVPFYQDVQVNGEFIPAKEGEYEVVFTAEEQYLFIRTTIDKKEAKVVVKAHEPKPGETCAVIQPTAPTQIPTWLIGLGIAAAAAIALVYAPEIKSWFHEIKEKVS